MRIWGFHTSIQTWAWREAPCIQLADAGRMRGNAHALDLCVGHTVECCVECDGVSDVYETTESGVVLAGAVLRQLLHVRNSCKPSVEASRRRLVWCT
jgi:hypothetical protein